MSSTSVTLGKHWELFMEQQISEGRYGSKSEILRNALRLLENQEKKLELLRRSLKEGEQSGMVPYDFAEICAELD